MNVIVDTSVWSLALRRKSSQTTPPVEKLTDLIQNEENIFLLGVVLQELLQGIKFSKDFARLLEQLFPFPLIEPHRKDYIEAARLRNHCSSKGVQAGTIDFLIASICIRYDCYLLTTDHDFNSIAGCSTLKLLK
ncbi:MAG: PIN domain-containing protein [Nitrospirae bacterium]|nr:PIN domain-containing protein [Nitrospirota bacterium]MBI3352375.1 PIN domain-containing protein [Nitrospirota bacterium]